MNSAGSPRSGTGSTLTLEGLLYEHFCRNLVCTATAQDLRQLFEPYGAVDTTEVITTDGPPVRRWVCGDAGAQCG